MSRATENTTGPPDEQQTLLITMINDSPTTTTKNYLSTIKYNVIWALSMSYLGFFYQLQTVGYYLRVAHRKIEASAEYLRDGAYVSALAVGIMGAFALRTAYNVAFMTAYHTTRFASRLAFGLIVRRTSKRAIARTAIPVLGIIISGHILARFLPLGSDDSDDDSDEDTDESE